MFGSFTRSWEFAKISYRLLGQNKRLILFPILSTLAALLILISFIVPLAATGQLAEWSQFLDEDSTGSGSPIMYITAFLFYFCNYFVVVFCNTGLMACTLKMLNGESATVSYGITFAMKRLPQLVGWALISAVVGVLLKAIENSNKRFGSIIRALLGSAWTALTYFVVPVIVVEGAGPIKAFKRSTQTLQSAWGTALAGNFSMGLIGFLFTLPIILLFILFIFMGVLSSPLGLLISIVLLIALIVIICAITGAADSIFKAVLYAYVSGKTIPEDIDTDSFEYAFRQK